MNWAELVRWADDALVRLQSLPEKIAHLPAYVLLAIVAYCSLFALVTCVGWSRSSAQRKHRARAAHAMERDVTELQAKYDAEMKWRAAAERSASSSPGR